MALAYVLQRCGHASRARADLLSLPLQRYGRTTQLPISPLPLGQDALTRQHFVGAGPSGQLAQALQPRMNVGVARGHVVAAFFQRLEHVTAQRKVGHGGLIAHHEVPVYQVG